MNTTSYATPSDLKGAASKLESDYRTLLGAAITDTLRGIDEPAPEGVLFAAFQVHGISLNTFQEVVNGLIAEGKVRRLAGPQLVLDEGIWGAV